MNSGIRRIIALASRSSVLLKADHRRTIIQSVQAMKIEFRSTVCSKFRLSNCPRIQLPNWIPKNRLKAPILRCHKCKKSPIEKSWARIRDVILCWILISSKEKKIVAILILLLFICILYKYIIKWVFVSDLVHHCDAPLNNCYRSPVLLPLYPQRYSSDVDLQDLQ